MPVQSRVLILLEGLTGLEQAKTVLLDEETINFYPVEDGYLQNYPGRADYYDRSKGESPWGDGWGTPLSNSLKYTRVSSFVDYTKVEHLVVVANDKLYEVVGNGYVELFTFKGKKIDGACYPTMFIHESKLIILNEGDFPMIWDGVDGVVPLGVQETPSAPTCVKNSLPWLVNFAADPFIDGTFWYHYLDGQPLPAGTSRTDSSSAAIEGWYECVVQFVDKYGNHGKASAPSSIFSIVNKATYSTAWDSDSWTCEWVPPRSDEHIHSVRQGRSLTLNPDDNAPLGTTGVYYTEWLQEGTTQHRRWQRLSDSVLANTAQIDMFVHGPPSGSIGASFARRIYILKQDGNVAYSDLALFGQFRATQQFSPYSEAVAIVPAGDRLFVVGTSSTEVWYESGAGPALLERDISNGSRFGSTFVAVGDGIIFGLWNEGFGYYNGQEHTYIPVPYYLKKFYLGEMASAVRSAAKINDWYYLAIRKDQVSAENNVILMYNFRTGRWFIVEDSVRDIAFWNEEIIGVDNSVYVLYRGNTFAASTIQTAGIVAGEISDQRTISDVRLLMEPSSINDVTITVSGESRDQEESGSGKAYPREGINISSPVFAPYWNKPNTNYGSKWSAPGDVFLQMEHSKPVPGFYHKIKVEFSAGHLVRIKGLEVAYSKSSRPEDR